MKKNLPNTPKETKLIHIDPATHIKFKQFCIINNQSMQILAAKALKDFMKSRGKN